MSKPRSDSKLLNLPPAAQDRICAWLTEGVGETGDTSYDAVREQIRLDFNIRVSKGPLNDFWNKVVAPRRLRVSADAAQALGKEAEGLGIELEGAALAVCQQKAFEILASPNPDPKHVIAFFGSVLEARKIALKKDEISLKRSQFQMKTCEAFLKWFADKRAREIVEGSGSNAEKIERLGQAMFGEDWETE